MSIHEPGSDGEMTEGFEPSGFKDWHWGAVYTLRPSALVTEDRPSRMLVAVRRKLAPHQDFTAYAEKHAEKTAPDAKLASGF